MAIKQTVTLSIFGRGSSNHPRVINRMRHWVYKLDRSIIKHRMNKFNRNKLYKFQTTNQLKSAYKKYSKQVQLHYKIIDKVHKKHKVIPQLYKAQIRIQSKSKTNY